MSPRTRTRFLVLLGLALAVYVLAWALGVTVAVNSTPSMARGLYVVVPDAAPKAGQIVAVCVPDRSAAEVYRARQYLRPSPRCPVGLAPLLKPLVAGPGDTVSITAQGVVVNGALQPNSRVMDTDSEGRPVDHLPLGWSATLGPRDFFALATRIERSLDSRYYGPVSRDDLQGRAFALITF